jgi:transcriptional regulator with PAS, ATPase and Fis domain
VLLEGETGTGKELFARIIHNNSQRENFLAVNCGAFPSGLIESELFGHVRGAFTGASHERKGAFEEANGGTIFLDEIGELELSAQVKLLRVLESGEIQRVGSDTNIQTDVRVIAATNRDLEEEVRAGRFRRDLFERLNFVPIRIPPLRERPEDIPLLLLHILRHSDGGRWVEMSEEALSFLHKLDFSWPGNVRHLEHLGARLALERFDRPVTAKDVRQLLDTSAAGAGETRRSSAAELEMGLPMLLAMEERKWLQEALTHHPNLTRADLAAKLKISEAALYKKLREYELT